MLSITEPNIVDNIIYFNGEESLVPGILQKTMNAYKFFENDLDKYDYTVRSNISTIIDFSLLASELIENPIHFYGGGHKRNLQWLGFGIVDSTWYGTEYIEGTAIMLTPTAVKYLIKNENLLRIDIVDDVSIGIFMREHAPNVKIQDINARRYAYVPCFYQNNMINLNAIHNMVNNHFIFYRNKCHTNRIVDVAQMNIIKNILLDKFIKLI